MNSSWEMIERASQELLNINSKIWAPTYYGGVSFASYLNLEQWKTVIHILIEYEFICYLYKGDSAHKYDFEVKRFPTYPGVDPETIFHITPHHLSKLYPNMSMSEQEIRAFKTLHKLSSSDKNLTMLRICELPQPASEYRVFEYDYMYKHYKDL